MKPKIIFPALPSATVIICDDIRQEVAGKLTYVGTYNNRMFMGEMPGILPKLCFSVLVRDEVDQDDDLTIKVLFEGADTIDNLPPVIQDDYDVGEVLFELTVSSEASPHPNQKAEPEVFVMKEGRINFAISPFHVPSPGRLKIRAYRDNVEIRVGAMIIDRMESLNHDDVDDSD